MKTPEEKIQFKNHFFKLGQGRVIAPSDRPFWRVFWTVPRDALDIFELLTPYDVQTVRDQNLPNMLVFAGVLVAKLSEFARASAKKPHQEILNCVRLLTKILPFVFELPVYHLEIEPRVFLALAFNPLELLPAGAGPGIPVKAQFAADAGDTRILAARLVFALVDLLFAASFTVDPAQAHAPGSALCLWEPGLGVAANYRPPDAIYDSHRSDILRLLLVLASTTFYERVPNVVPRGLVFMTLLVCAVPKQAFFNLVCSLTNLVCRSGRVHKGDSGLEQEHAAFVQLRLACLTLALQLLAQMLAYAVPGAQYTSFLARHRLLDTASPINRVRAFFSRLSKESDLVFLASSLLAVIRSPMLPVEASGRLKTYRSLPLPMSPSVMVILWELMHCNGQFGGLVAGRFASKLAPCILYHVFAFYDVPLHAHSVKIAAYFLLYLSSQRSFVKSLLMPVLESMADLLPPEFRLAGPITARDFLVIHTCQVLIAMTANSGTKSPAASDMQSFILPTLVECLYNVIPHTNPAISGTDSTSKGLANLNPRGGISYQACRAVNQVLVLFSTRHFLTQAPQNAGLLALLLRALCAAATKSPAASRMLMFSFLEEEAMYDNIWSAVHSLENQYFCGKTARLVNVQEDDCSGDECSGKPPNIDSSEQASINSESSGEIWGAESKDPMAPPAAPGRRGASAESSIDKMEALEIAESLRPTPPAGMSAKAREKLPRDAPINLSWGGNEALRTILIFLIPSLKEQLGENWGRRRETVQDSFRVVKKIEYLDMARAVEKHRPELHYDFLPDTPVARLTATRNYLSLGWYVAMHARDVFCGVETIKSYMGASRSLASNISSSLAMFGKFASSWSGMSNSKPLPDRQDAAVTDYVEANYCAVNVWADTAVRLFKSKADDEKVIQAFGMKFGSVGLATSVNEITSSLVKRFSDFRGGHRASVSSAGSVYSGVEEIQEAARLTKRDSVSSLHSLNTLNRARSHTPRNSMS
ncbi:hypothetical protein METBIDRAFT_15406, partial [Metschnikowia bicuspidata var. bicuspidata NRRL YB-4993]